LKPIHLIVACSANRTIGRQGTLPWTIAEDTAFFKTKTSGNTVIVGRRSLEDWPDAGFGRDVVAVTSTLAATVNAARPEGFGSFACAPNLESAIAKAQGMRGDIYLCGGERIYQEGLAIATGSLFLTLIYAHVEGDRFFPDWRGHFPREISRREGSEGTWRYAFVELAR